MVENNRQKSARSLYDQLLTNHTPQSALISCARSLYDQLLTNHTPQSALISRKKLSIRENSTIYRLELSKSVLTAVFRIDGVIITSGLRCDSLVLIEGDMKASLWDLVFVELKGTDVLHAIRQLRETIKSGLFMHTSNRHHLARVVGNSFPSCKSNPAIEKAKIEFRSCLNFIENFC